MLTYVFFVILFSNLLVGILLGMSSIGGFLLPLVYIGVLQFSVSTSLALSFMSFAVAGLIGSYFYWKSNDMDLKLATLLNIGSLPGALIGVQLNIWIPEHIAKLIMYIVILLSALSLLINRQKREDAGGTHKVKRNLKESKSFAIVLGFITAAICSLTGAGGPILVVPLLMFFGLNVRTAVGVGLLNSVIIAIPAVFGYFHYSNIGDVSNPISLISASLAGQVIGIFLGSHFSNKIKIAHLRVFISSITILSAIYMIVAALA